MKLLLDQNISYRAIKPLSAEYTEVAQIGRLGMAQTDDAMVWQYARTHDFMMVTFDPYFSERNIISGHPIKVIWLRFPNTRTEVVVDMLLNSLEKIEAFSKNKQISCLELFQAPKA